MYNIFVSDLIYIYIYIYEIWGGGGGANAPLRPSLNATMLANIIPSSEFIFNLLNYDDLYNIVTAFVVVWTLKIIINCSF